MHFGDGISAKEGMNMDIMDEGDLLEIFLNRSTSKASFYS